MSKQVEKLRRCCDNIAASGNENLYEVAKEYVGILEKIEKTKDPEKICLLEETRSELHGKFMDMLKKQGVKFKDREHATRIAYAIVRGQ